MNLNDASLFKRYVYSLLTKRRDLVQSVLDKGGNLLKPKSLEDMVKWVKKIVKSRQQSQQLVYG